MWEHYEFSQIPCSVEDERQNYGDNIGFLLVVENILVTLYFFVQINKEAWIKL